MSRVLDSITRHRTICCAALLACAAPVGVCLAGANDYTTNYAACPSSECPPHSLAWSTGEFDQIHLVDIAGPPRHQPQRLDAAALTDVLRRIRVVDHGKSLAVFGSDGATNFAKGLAVAMAEAGPRQDALFLITGGGGFSGLIGNQQGNSGRAFIDGAGLNLIFGEVGVDFAGAYNGAGLVRHFDFGSHTVASHVLVSGVGLQQVRADWLVVPLAVQAAQARAARAAPAVEAAPAVDATPAAEATPAAPATPPVKAVIPAHDAAFYASQELRLERLKKLHDKHLITDQEYTAKQMDILKDW